MSHQNRSCDSVRSACVPSGRPILESLVIPGTVSTASLNNSDLCKSCSCCVIIEEYTIEDAHCHCSETVQESHKPSKTQNKRQKKKRNGTDSKESLQKTPVGSSSNESYASNTSDKTNNKKYASTSTDAPRQTEPDSPAKTNSKKLGTKTPICCDPNVDADTDIKQCFKGKTSVCADREKHSGKDKNKAIEKPVNGVKLSEPTTDKKACCKMATCPRSGKATNQDSNKGAESNGNGKTRNIDGKDKSSPCNCTYPPEFRQYSCGGTPNVKCKCTENKSKK